MKVKVEAINSGDVVYLRRISLLVRGANLSRATFGFNEALKVKRGDGISRGSLQLGSKRA